MCTFLSSPNTSSLLPQIRLIFDDYQRESLWELYAKQVSDYVETLPEVEVSGEREALPKASP